MDDLEKNIRVLYQRGDYFLLEWDKNPRITSTKGPEYLIARGYEPREKVWKSAHYFGWGKNALVTAFNDLAINKNEVDAPILEYDKSKHDYAAEFQERVLEQEQAEQQLEQERIQKEFLGIEDKNIYEVTLENEKRYVAAERPSQALQTIQDIDAKEQYRFIDKELYSVETATIEDIPDGDVLFDEDGSPMEVQDAKSLISKDAKSGATKSNRSFNQKQGIYSGKVEKVQNKELEFREKRLNEREISRDNTVDRKPKGIDIQVNASTPNIDNRVER